MSLTFAGLGLLAAAAPSVPPQIAPNEASVTITVTDLRNAKGVVRACLTDDAGNFPKCAGEKHVHRVVAAAAASEITLRFENVSPGRYAIALIHDENDNDRMDRAMLMMPKEGYGFSRDAKVVLGPPKFSAAAFDVGSGPIHQTIRMRYMF